jgi:hypothetical protein
MSDRMRLWMGVPAVELFGDGARTAGQISEGAVAGNIAGYRVPRVRDQVGRGLDILFGIKWVWPRARRRIAGPRRKMNRVTDIRRDDGA